MEMHVILCGPPHSQPGDDPSRILPQLYIGSDNNAQEERLLKTLGITHVLNCAGNYYCSKYRKEFCESLGIKYEQFDADDTQSYNMLQHVDRAVRFINDAKRSHGIALVHCMKGINRSGFICAAYVMLTKRLSVVGAVRLMKRQRAKVLSNDGFCRQLIQFGKQQDLLE